MAVVFDTYAWIEYFRGSKQGNIVKNYLESEDVITPVIVLLELSYHAHQEGWDIRKYLSFIKIHSRIAGINDIIILEFGKIYQETKKKIKGISFADIFILTTAFLENAKILTGDSHFKSFERTIFLE